MLSVGAKFMPFPPITKFIRTNVGPIVEEFSDLKRRLYLSAYFHLPHCSGEKTPTSTRIRNLTAKSGIFQRLGERYHKIHNGVEHYKDIALMTLSSVNEKVAEQPGVKLAPHSFSSFLKEHVGIGGDKDGTSIVMSLETYNNSTCKLSPMVFRYTKKMGEIDERHKWESAALSWHRALQELVIGFSPSPQLGKTLSEFFYASRNKPSLSCFRFLVKTHHNIRLNTAGGWASRLLVGLTRWGTSVSLLSGLWTTQTSSMKPTIGIGGSEGARRTGGGQLIRT